MLDNEDSLPQLVQQALDTTRHDRMLDHAGGDIAVFSEIKTVQQLLLRQPNLDMLTIGKLAVHRDELLSRQVPLEDAAAAPGDTPDVAEVKGLLALVAGLAAFGELGRARAIAAKAETIARSISDEADRRNALIHLVEALIAADHFEHAEAVAREIHATFGWFCSMVDLVAGLARAGRYDYAEKLVVDIIRQFDRSQAVGNLMRVLAPTAPDEAERIADLMPTPFHRLEAMTECVVAVVNAGDRDLAGTLADKVTATIESEHLYHQLGHLIQLTAAMVDAADLDRAFTLADRAEATARALDSDYEHAEALTSLIEIFTKAGASARASAAINEAATVANAVFGYERRVRAFTNLASGLARAGYLDRARTTGYHAELMARAMDDEDRSEILAELTIVFARIGDLDRAETTARRIPDLREHSRALVALTTYLTESGDLDRAERTARRIPDLTARPEAFMELATVFARTDPDAAVNIVTRNTSPLDRAEALTALVSVLANAAEIDRARAVADSAEAAARDMAPGYFQDQTLISLAAKFAQIGNTDRAKSLIATCWCTSRWDVPIAVLATIDPQTLRAIADYIATE